ncbi:solute carrier family 2, facilitated glucose transporter member 5-like [Podarcis muralis]
METSNTSIPKCKKKELTPGLLIATVIPSLGSLQLGYIYWVVLNPETVSHINSNITEETERMDIRIEEAQTGWMAFNAMVFPIGGIIGSLMLGTLVDSCGRRRSLMLNNATAAVACGLMGASSARKFYDFGIFARFLVGLSSGLFSTMIPLYVGELAPVSMRGAFTMMSILFFTVGLLLAQAISSPNILGNKKHLPVMLGLTGIVAFFNIPLLLLCPESPRYLFIQMKNEAKARKALKMLRNKVDMENEIEELRKEEKYEIQEKDMTILSLLKSHSLRRQVITIAILLGGQQFSGIIGGYFYAEKIYRSLLSKESHIFYMNLSVTCWLLFIASITMSVIDSVGRRFLLLLGFLICSVSCVLLTLTLELQPMQPWMIYLSSVLVIAMLTGYMFGPAIITYVVTLEIFLQSSRATAFTLGGIVNWITRCFAVGIFLKLEPLTGPYSLLILWPLCMVTFIYISAMVPETRGMTFLEIRQSMDLQAKEDKERIDRNPKI